MEKNKKNEELQSRREFFKKAAKGALPIIAALVLANVPQLSEASDPMGCMGCQGTCMATCKGTCSNKCLNACATGCDNYCSRTCKSTSR